MLQIKINISKKLIFKTATYLSSVLEPLLSLLVFSHATPYYVFYSIMYSRLEVRKSGNRSTQNSVSIID